VCMIQMACGPRQDGLEVVSVKWALPGGGRIDPMIHSEFTDFQIMKLAKYVHFSLNKWPSDQFHVISVCSIG